MKLPDRDKVALAYVCSPLKGDVSLNRNVAIGMGRVIKGMLWRGRTVIPVVPHTASFYLDDDNPKEREWGMAYCLSLLAVCDLVVIPSGYALTEGMAMEVDAATKLKMPIATAHYRTGIKEID